MQSIALPKKIEFKKGERDNEGVVVLEPCYPGYGTTLGNALRRVLLSSLNGAAVVGIKVKGASHEFMAVPHVKEDVLEIVLNLKGLRLKMHTEEVVSLELDVHGAKTVTAGDIKKNSLVEIVNPELNLATITDMAGSLTMEIFVKGGRGYETIENRVDDVKETGYIDIDSIFSPVISVGIKVENVRVGNMTNWDKLILNILTDGTIDPEDAFKKSVSMLLDQFHAVESLMAGEEPVAKVVEEEEAEEAVEADAETPSEDSEEPAKKKRGRPKKAE